LHLDVWFLSSSFELKNFKPQTPNFKQL